jgi:hypothetical protein
MEVIGQLYTPAALTPRKETLAPIGKEYVCVYVCAWCSVKSTGTTLPYIQWSLLNSTENMKKHTKRIVANRCNWKFIRDFLLQITIETDIQLA